MTRSRPGPPVNPRRNAALLVAVASLAAFAMHAAGHGVLASPRHWSVHSWQALVTEQGVPIAALVVVRVLALAACVYLVGLGLLTILFARARNRTVRRWLAAFTPRLLRPALGVVGALSFATPAYATDPSSPPVMVLVTTTTTPAPSSPPPTMRRLAEALDRATSTTVAPPATAVPTLAPSVTTVPSTASTIGPPAAPAGDAIWTVDRGDHFWHIAEATMYVRLGRAPNLHETDAYWRVLIDANRSRLVDAHNPDLLFAGQEIVLPPHR